MWKIQAKKNQHKKNRPAFYRNTILVCIVCVRGALNKHIFRVICCQSKWIKITYILQWTAKTNLPWRKLSFFKASKDAKKCDTNQTACFVRAHAHAYENFHSERLLKFPILWMRMIPHQIHHDWNFSWCSIFVVHYNRHRFWQWIDNHRFWRR